MVNPPPGPNGPLIYLPIEVQQPPVNSPPVVVIPILSPPVTTPPVTSPVTTIQPATLTLTAAGNDQLVVQFTDATDFTISLDGQTNSYNTTQYNAINFTGATGSSAVVAGVLGNTSVAFAANSVAITGAGFTLNISNTDTIYVYGGSSQTAQLNGGTGGNTLVVLPGYSEMYGTGIADFAVGSGRPTATARARKTPPISMPAPGDNLSATPTTAISLAQIGYFQPLVLADGFSSILLPRPADGSGQAWLYGATTGTNSFVANQPVQLHVGPRVLQRSHRLQSVIGVSGNASDYAYLTDTAGGASFSGYSSYSFLAGANFNYQAIGFANVVATGTTSDQAAVYDSNPTIRSRRILTGRK